MCISMQCCRLWVAELILKPGWAQKLTSYFEMSYGPLRVQLVLYLLEPCDIMSQFKCQDMQGSWAAVTGLWDSKEAAETELVVLLLS